MNNYKAVIVDDEYNNISILKHFISKYCLNVEVVGEAQTGSEAISIINNTTPDILFLDIRLKGQEVFEVLDQIEVTKAQVIFVTSHEEYALKAFKYNAIDYILKPIVIEELIIAINKAKRKIEQENFFDFKSGITINKVENLQQENKDYIAVASLGKIELIKTSDIMYVASDNKYATFYLISGKEYISNKNLLYYEEMLDKACFFRIHKSYIINIRFTSRILKKDGSYCELINGVLLPIAKRKQDDFNRFLKIKD